jgi:hypothetical protein
MVEQIKWVVIITIKAHVRIELEILRFPSKNLFYRQLIAITRGVGDIGLNQSRISAKRNSRQLNVNRTINSRRTSAMSPYL